MTGRRTQRSARLTAALVLLLLSAALVVAALVVGSLLAASAAAVVALAGGAAAYVLARGEIVVVRRTTAAERSALAKSYRELFEKRAEESALAQRKLRVSLALAQRRAARAEAQLADPVQDLMAWEQRASEAADSARTVQRRSA